MAEQVETNEAQADGMAALAELKQDAPEQQVQQKILDYDFF